MRLHPLSFLKLGGLYGVLSMRAIFLDIYARF